jgi:hypothetical protein
MSQRGGRRRIDQLLRVLGAADFRVGGKAPYEMTTTGAYTIEQRQALVAYLAKVCPGFWESFGDIEPPILAQVETAECVLLNDLTVAILDTGWNQFPTDAALEADRGAVQNLIGYLLRVIY